MVALPFNEKQMDLGSTFEIARHRYFSLERRLKRDSNLRDQYHLFMKNYAELEHMELIAVFNKSGYYIPNHPVLKESSLTTKLREVYDGPTKPPTGYDRKIEFIKKSFVDHQPLRTYQLNTITYGTASAPFLATRCLKQLAEDERGNFPKAGDAIRNDIYVNDLLTEQRPFKTPSNLETRLWRSRRD
ncbi:uncharacterized protein LOC122503658 [Leptopilina heterotoma]|uniref:uncharacterized protein LOC122503658 n=1 Tax=Leptopilina heterotoma TaxID=63436 RepID=UPI001CA96AE6|nr:uncharacterized protein LOC122503658 [Leptopilina heterotoma]